MSLPNPTSPGKPQSAVKSGFHPGASKRGKSHNDLTGDPVADYVGGPQPVPYPGAGPHPQAAPHHAAPHPAPAPGGGYAAQAMPMPGGIGGGMPYQPPGIAQGYGDPTLRLLQLLMGGQ